MARWHDNVAAGLCGCCSQPWPGRSGGKPSDLCDWCDTEQLAAEERLMKSLGRKQT